MATLAPSAVTLFCGSSPGVEPLYLAAAAAFGRTVATRGLGLVYGGGRLGVMGAAADAALRAGGAVAGVIPDFLVAAEHAHAGLTRLDVVSSMHERKARMAELGGAFVALPGGLGTFEELFEALTWSQLGIHPKPIGVLEVGDYFEPLHALLDHAVRSGFLHQDDRARLLVAREPDELLDLLESAETMPSSITTLRSRS